MEHRAGELFSGTLAVTIPSLRSEVGTLSGGQRQQVAVARSLLGEPKVVLLDEPTAALGVPQTKQVLDLIRRLRERDLGVVVISHNLADVFEVADRIVVLRLGSDRRRLHSRADHRGACRRGDHRPGGNGDEAAADAEERVEQIEEDGDERSSRRGTGELRARRAGAVKATTQETLRRFIQGDLASLRVVIGLAVIWIIFQSQNDRFLSAENLTNLMLQITAVGLISVGIVYVLLLGEIDLSVGAVSGLAAAVHGGAQRQARLEPLPGDRRGHRRRAWRSGSSRASSSAASASRRSSSPWPGLLAWQGALLQVLGSTGSINLTDPKITGLANTFYSDAVGWIIAAVVIVGLRRGARLAAPAAAGRRARQRRA